MLFLFPGRPLEGVVTVALRCARGTAQGELIDDVPGSLPRELSPALQQNTADPVEAVLIASYD